MCMYVRGIGFGAHLLLLGLLGCRARARKELVHLTHDLFVAAALGLLLLLKFFDKFLTNLNDELGLADSLHDFDLCRVRYRLTR